MLSKKSEFKISRIALVFTIVSVLFSLAFFVKAQESEKPVFGVFHSIHTTISDGAETPSQRVDNLKNYYGWASTVDHDVQVDAGEWAATRDEANNNNLDNSFSCFLGYEWKGAAANNAEITAFFADNGSLTKANGNDANYDTFSEFASWLSANNGMGCINHPARSSNVVDWTNPGVNSEYLPCVEMLNKNYYHWNNYWICANDSGCTTYANPRPDSSNWQGAVKNALDNGLHLGFVAGWDYHGGYPGVPTAYIGLVNPTNWTKQSIFDTVKLRHTWAAEDKIMMSIIYNDGAQTYVMGDIFSTESAQIPIDYNITAVSGQVITDVNLFFDGIITEVDKFSSQYALGSFNINLPDNNEHYVFVEAIQGNGKRAWASPMYITYTVLTVCGNNIKEPGEECDGIDDSACPGLCQEDCSCYNPCGDDYCDGRIGESCTTCPADCISGTIPGGSCSACFKGICDGVCHPIKENSNCADCNPGTSYCCGDSICQGNENLINCFYDCSCSVNEDCNDNNACTADICNAGACSNTWPVCGIADGCCGPTCAGSGDIDCATCSACFKGKCDGKCDTRREGLDCLDCV